MRENKDESGEKIELKPLAFNLLLSIFSLSFLSAQDTLYVQNFSQNPDFTLNTPDEGGTQNGSNKWVINDTYMGGNGSLICLGFPFTFSILSTNPQPVAIQGSPNSEYLHILSEAAEVAGIQNANYISANGVCDFAESNFAAQSTDISTLSYSNISLTFWWMCGGSPEAYGEVYYSTDGGISWTLLPTEYRNQTSWAKDSLTIPALSNQAQVRFGFRFVNEVSTTGSDPGFAIDDVVLTGAPTLSLQADSLSDTLLCSEGSELLTLHFSAEGSFSPTNQFIAEISDEFGDFNNPFPIGTIIAQSDSSILCQLLSALPPGSGHKIRVRSTDPPLVGLDSLSITLASVNFVEGVEAMPDRLCPGDSTVLTGQFVIGSPLWQVSSDGQTFTDLPGGNTNPYTYQPVDSTVFVRLSAQNGICPDAFSENIPLQVAPVEAGFGFEVDANDPLTVTFADSSLGAVIWNWDFGDGVSDTSPAPTHTFPAPATYEVCLISTSATGCSDTVCQNITLSATQLTFADALSLRAIPTQDGVSLLADSKEPVSAYLYEMSGKMLASEEIAQFPYDWRIPGLVSGIYLIRVEDSHGEWVSQKIRWE